MSRFHAREQHGYGARSSFRHARVRRRSCITNSCLLGTPCRSYVTGFHKRKVQRRKDAEA